MIVQHGPNHFEVQSKEGKSLGHYHTKAEAEKRLRQVEYFKAHPEAK